jgi:uncharacterized membrane protein
VKRRLAAVVIGLALTGVVAPAAMASEPKPTINATAYPVCYTRVPLLNIGLCIPWNL